MQNRDQQQVRPGRQSGSSEGTQPRSQGVASTTSASLPARQQHSEGSTESWIEIESRPSSSSLSSAADEIITTGLRVQHDSNTHRRRRRRAVSVGHFQIGTGYRVRAEGGGNSSQEEYDESESESDRVMTSSTEGIGPSPLQHELRRPSRNAHSVASSETMSEREGDDENEDDDENATAVNYPRSTGRQFEPRPNAFSHPPTDNAARTEAGASSMPRRPAARAAAQRHSFPQHSPYNTASPNYQPDHDEALRASLSTLLSAAAAVRGLPKPGQTRVNSSNPSNRVDPTSLRLVPESVALGDIPEDASSNHISSCGTPSVSSPTSSDKSKRKASPPTNTNIRSNSRDRRAVKKARRIGPEEISPTLLTWVVSAGVVVLVSALSFSAGYVVGKEAGHAEAMGKLGAVGGEAGRCGKEATSGMGLRRLRWTAASAVVRV